MILAVLDTNTIVSGSFWPNAPQQVYVAGLTNRFQILTSAALFAELSDVLHRAKFAPILTKLGKSADDLLDEFREVAEFVTAAEIPQDAVRDPKDVSVLACAVGGKADFIVSGDKDLLVLGSYENIPIVNATEFLSTINS